MAEAIIRKLHGEAFRRLCRHRSHQGLQAAARHELTHKSDLSKKVKRLLVQLDLAHAWVRHASEGRATEFMEELERAMAEAEAVGRVTNDTIDNVDYKKDSLSHADPWAAAMEDSNTIDDVSAKIHKQNVDLDFEFAKTHEETKGQAATEDSHADNVNAKSHDKRDFDTIEVPEAAAEVASYAEKDPEEVSYDTVGKKVKAKRYHDNVSGKEGFKKSAIFVKEASDIFAEKAQIQEKDFEEETIKDPGSIGRRQRIFEWKGPPHSEDMQEGAKHQGSDAVAAVHAMD